MKRKTKRPAEQESGELRSRKSVKTSWDKVEDDIFNYYEEAELRYLVKPDYLDNQVGFRWLTYFLSLDSDCVEREKKKTVS